MSEAKTQVETLVERIFRALMWFGILNAISWLLGGNVLIDSLSTDFLESIPIVGVMARNKAAEEEQKEIDAKFSALEASIEQQRIAMQQPEPDKSELKALEETI